MLQYTIFRSRPSGRHGCKNARLQNCSRASFFAMHHPEKGIRLLRLLAAASNDTHKAKKTGNEQKRGTRLRSRDNRYGDVIDCAIVA